jgi:hypothetical protein
VTLTKAKVLAAARKKWGTTVQLRENKSALTPAEKEVLRASQKELLARKKAADEERKALGDVQAPLLAAARFALDVDGDEPAWTRLKQATERAQRAKELAEELADLGKQTDHNSGLLLRDRYELTQDDEVIPGFPVRRVLARKDTLEELATEVGLPALKTEA